MDSKATEPPNIHCRVSEPALAFIVFSLFTGRKIIFTRLPVPRVFRFRMFVAPGFLGIADAFSVLIRAIDGAWNKIRTAHD